MKKFDGCVCTGRVAKAGAAACKHCGGAGGGSEWAKAFAVDLCEIFDCPEAVRREVSAVGVVSFLAFVTGESEFLVYTGPKNRDLFRDC